jgi:hypothetical protein
MTQDFFAPHGASILNLIDQIEFSNLETEAERVEYAYNKGLEDAKKNSIACDFPIEYPPEGEWQE